MEWHQIYFEMLYRLVRRQNEWLLHQIAVRENIPTSELKPLMPSMPNLRQFLRDLPHGNDEAPLNPNAGHSRANA